MIKDQTYHILIQNAIDYGFVDRIYLSKDCNKIRYDSLKSQLCNLTQNENCCAKFFSISLEYNEDNGIVIKAFHAITLNSTMDKDKKSTKSKNSAWKNDRLKKKELFSPLCHHQLDDTY